ncbi:hypothetical protein AAFF_G00092330 [Aldrovandia affinis]|uniref:Homeobox domain-containing protein n=1 Tax=Aldrovandia affinis TaxID=143900 RepID=A0AAD7T2K0_9TELE|nr:hypothetical protein AAFF_G00092330 [Aldrovandia affinis]
MADWKMSVSYNYNPSYHAYAYGLMYPQGPEQNRQNLGWPEAAYNHPAVGGAYYSTPPPPPQQQQQPQSPPWNSEDGQTSSHFPGSVLYFADSHTQSGRLFLSHNRTPLNQRPTESERASSDTPSDSEAHTPAGPSTIAQGKARTAFSEDQMTALTHRFSVQRYLTPVEMKTLAGLTGLAYKQVKTWFQNRRMKLKRHQKDNSWVSERYPNSGYRNIAPHSQFQMDTPALAQDHYSNPQFRDAVFKKSPPQTPTYYHNYPGPPSSPNPNPSTWWLESSTCCPL